MKIGIIKEGKNPPDHRAPLTPLQCKYIGLLHPEFEFLVQKSLVRAITDAAYLEKDLLLTDHIQEADYLFGIKEVPIQDLIPNKTYFFFSHTIKKQAYNRDLLRAVLKKNITLIDYECLTDDLGSRTVAFGRFAGIVGAYNAILGYSKRYRLFDILPANQCQTLKNLKQELHKVKLPAIKIVITGTGRVGKGAKEMLDLMRIKQVFPQEFLKDTFHEPVYTILRSDNYYQPKSEDIPENLGFYTHPENYSADFMKYAQVSDIFISTHYWNPKAAILFTKAQAKQADFKIRMIADISCDIEGSVPITLKSSTISEPFYDYNPISESIEIPFSDERNITMMAVDNLPCELPADASESFGEQLMQYVFPALLNGDADGMLERATIAKNGSLKENYIYLEDFVKEKIGE